MRPAQIMQGVSTPTGAAYRYQSQLAQACHARWVQADELVIPLSTARAESQLELLNDNGDNSPLRIRAITAIFARLGNIQERNNVMKWNA